MSEYICDECGSSDVLGPLYVCEACTEKEEQTLNSLRARIKELEEKLNNEWKPASEAVEGCEYDVCGGEYLHYSQYSDYDEWEPMTSDVAVATCEEDKILESSFTGEYADEYGARWYYRPKWIRERPTPPTPQEGGKE